MLTHELLAAGAKEAAEDERHDEDVVELSGNRDEVRDEVKGKCEVPHERGEKQLAPAWHALVGHQA